MTNVQEQTNLTTADMATAGTRTDVDQAAQQDMAKGQSMKDTSTPTATPADNGQVSAAQDAPLFSDDEAQKFRSRWDDIQAGFVDEPRQAVEQADNLVAEVMKRLATVFADERNNLEQQWARGDDISTEDLRVALQRYRSFFDRLLTLQ
jgi:hypothetical protein